MGCWRGLKFGFNVRRTSQTFGRGKKTNFLAKKLTKTSNAFGNFFEESKTGLLLSDSKFSGPIFCCHFFQSHFLLLNFFALFWFFSVLLKSSMLGFACLKFGFKIWASCSKFGVSIFEVFEVWYFDVSSTSNYKAMVLH